MKTIIKTVLMWAGLAVLIQVSAAQAQETIMYSANADAVFENGVILYNNGKYAEAYEAFSRLLGQNRWHQRLTAALLMRAKTSYMLKSYKGAEEDIRELAKVFPESKYIDDAQILMGLIHFQRRDLLNATRSFLLTVDFAKDQRIRDKGEAISRILLDDYLTADMMERLQPQITSPNAKGLLVLSEARKYLQDEQVGEARLLIDNYIAEWPGSRYRSELLELRKDDSFARDQALKVGVVLPLSGELSIEGQAMYRGVRFAEELHKKNPGDAQRVELIVRDSESSMIKAVKETHQLLKDRRVLGLIGELDAMITAGLAGIAEAESVPFVAPATAENGLATIGDHVFQITPDYETQARDLARFAIDSLHFHTFVTIAPQDEYGRQMVDAFSAEVDRLGGEILTQRWYYGVPENLGRQFKLIREVAFRRGLEDTLRPKYENFAQLDKDSLWRAFNYQMMTENNLDESMVDLSSHFPVRNIDGVFLPIYSEDVKYVARQLSYYNINSQILGGEKWYNEEFFKDRDLMRYIQGAIIASSYYIDKESATYKTFRDQFRLSEGVTPEKWEMLGYDAVNLMYGALASGASDRSSLQNKLSNYGYFQGMRGVYELSWQSRINDVVYLLQIESMRFRKIE